jgi:hypothetical protein
MEEEISGIFVYPRCAGALEFLLSVPAGQEPDAKGPGAARCQHIPDRVPDHDRVLNLNSKAIGCRQE